MKARRICTQREFLTIAALLAPEGRAVLVARIEAAWRRALKVERLNIDGDVVATVTAEDLTDDEIVVATLSTESQSAFERAGLTVIRACIAFREAPEGHASACLDRIGLALADADPARLEGLKTRAERRAGTARSAESRAPEKHHAETLSKIRAMLAAGKKPNAKKLVAKGRSLSTVYKLIAQVNRELSAE